MTTVQFLVAGLAVLVGSGTQSVAGFGMNLVAVPIALLIGAEELVPGALLVVLFVQASTLALDERAHADWRLLRWFLPVRVIGAAAGLAVSVVLSGDGVVLVICGLVLGAVALSIGGWRVPGRPAPWMATGFASGFSNVLSSIGGPPLSLAMTDHAPPAQRATQGWSGMFGSAISMLMLLAAGRFGAGDIGRGILLVPVAIGGSYVVRPLRGLLPTADALRPIVWTVSIVGSLVTIGRTLLV